MSSYIEDGLRRLNFGQTLLATFWRCTTLGKNESMTNKHICLMGDSIFDNDEYIPGEPGVIEQLRRSNPKTWSAFKVAVDGDCIEDIPNQLERVPTHTTDIVVSIGGNDLMKFRHLLAKVAVGANLEDLIASPLADFEIAYGWMLDMVLEKGVTVSACTIYTAIPFEDPEMKTYAPSAISAFNVLILRLAEARKIPVIRLDLVCTDDKDFSEMSPIEPSSQGGQKIVDSILDALLTA
ncbi:MAG: SGNH/GDSL hydrolase family protein [Paracoccaceae bacterium]